MDNNDKNNKKKKHDNTGLIFYYVKLWAKIIVVLTILYLVCSYIINNDMYPYNPHKRREFLRMNTPSHPPPLINFMD